MEQVSTAEIRRMEPSLTQTPYGWLAISGRTAPLNIAVVGATPGEAQDRFRDSADAWARLHDVPEPS